MKVLVKVILWLLSTVLFILALAFAFLNLLSGAMLLVCAVLVNPLFVARVQIKKGLTAIFVMGLFIAAFAVLPNSAERAETNQPVGIEPVQASSVSFQNTAESTATTPAPAEPNRPKEAYSTRISLAIQAESATHAVPDTTDIYGEITVQAVTPHPSEAETRFQASSTTPSETQESIQLPERITERSSNIEVIDYTDVIERGEYASIQIKGAPNTNYTCRVKYKTQWSAAKGLNEKESDDKGFVSWEWKVSTNTSLDYRPTIYVQGGGDEVSVTFQVVE